MLVPEVLAHPAILTNGRGAYSAALAEFALAGLLFFAKDLRRLVARQTASAWEPFEMERLEGRTVGIVGYGDIGPSPTSGASTTPTRARSAGRRRSRRRRPPASSSTARCSS